MLTRTIPSSGEKIGIAECDEYIAKYEACTGNVPEAGRAAYKSALDQTRASWKRLKSPRNWILVARGALASDRPRPPRTGLGAVCPLTVNGRRLARTNRQPQMVRLPVW